MAVNQKMILVYDDFSTGLQSLKQWYSKKRNWYFIDCIWDTSDTSSWYNDYAGSRRSAGQLNKIFQSSIGLNTQWGFFWCLKINDFQTKPRVCLWPRDWEGNQAWSFASISVILLCFFIFNNWTALCYLKWKIFYLKVPVLKNFKKSRESFIMENINMERNHVIGRNVFWEEALINAEYYLWRCEKQYL